MIPQPFIDDLLQRVDLADLIDRAVPLKKAGQNYQACCPFHKEKSPSFSVSPTKQFYHCFGCGAHGNALGWLINYQGLEFVSAVRQLAAQVGLEVPHAAVAESAPVSDRDWIAAQLVVAAGFYASQLKGSPAADYLKRRGLSGEIALRFQLGYAPPQPQALATFLSDYHGTAVADAGLVIDSDGKTQPRRDRFRNRVMFPILDEQGTAIGFGGRALSEDSQPKYLNSPETALFSKGRELYGLHLAKPAIRQSGRVVVVEGYLDVIALAQFGIEEVVATCGTACTPDQLRKLLRLAEQVILCFDGDAAGQKAAWRALETCLPLLQDGKRVDLLLLPDGQDPDDCIRADGAERFRRRLDSELIPLSEWLFFQLNQQHALNSAEGRAAFAKAALPLLASVTAPVLKAVLRQQLAELVELPESTLDALLPTANRRNDRSRQAGSERLQLAIYAPRLALGMTLSPDDDPALHAVIDTIHAHPTLDTPQLLAALHQSPHHRTLVAAWAAAIGAFGRLTVREMERRGIQNHKEAV